MKKKIVLIISLLFIVVNAFAENHLEDSIIDFMKNGKYIRIEKSFWNKTYIKIIEYNEKELEIIYSGNEGDNKSMTFKLKNTIVTCDDDSNLIIHERK